MKRFSLLFGIPYLFLIGSLVSANQSDEYITMPTRDELNEIVLKAYECSSTNKVKSCGELRNLADPLMDNPLLSAVCKDLVWELLQSAKKSKINSLERRDSIDIPARKISNACLKKTKAINSPRGNQPRIKT